VSGAPRRGGLARSDQLSICCTLVLYPVYLERRSCLC